MVALLSCALGAGVSGCGEESSGKVATAADGLNLYAVASLIKSGRVHNAESLQAMLACGQGYNNLNLDGDDFCNDIQVTEYSNFNAYGFGAVRGYSLTAHLNDGSVQEVARIEIQNDARGVMLSIRGNEQIYGPGYNLNSRLASNVSAVRFLVWAFAPTRTYGYVPGVIIVERRTRVVPVTQYRQVTGTIVKEVPVEVKKETKAAVTSMVPSPNAGQVSTTIKAPLAAPTTVQQEFQKRPENKPVAVGSFGKTKPADQATPPATATPGVPKPLPQIGDKKPLPATSPVDKVDPKNIDQSFQKRDTDKSVTPGGFGKEKKPVEVPATPPAVAPTPPAATTLLPKEVPEGLPVSPKATEEKQEKKIHGGLPSLPKAETGSKQTTSPAAQKTPAKVGK